MATFLTEVTSRAHSHNSHSTFHPSEGPTISRFRSHAHPHPRTTPRPGLERVQETATVASGCENKEVESEQVFVREEGICTVHSYNLGATYTKFVLTFLPARRV